MIVRILGEGQWRLTEAAVQELNVIDEAVEAAVGAGSQQDLAAALERLHNKVRDRGVRLAADELADSDLILPGADATLEEVRALLDESSEGLVPN